MMYARWKGNAVCHPIGFIEKKSMSMKKQMIAFVTGIALALFASAALPKGYVQLEYIRSTGTQYIDTGYVHTPQTKVEADLEVPLRGQFREWAAAFGARETNYLNHCYCFFTHSGLVGAVYGRTGQEKTGNALFYGKRISLCCDRAQVTWRSVADPKRTGRITTTGTIDGGVNTMFIFNLNTGTAGGKKPDISPVVMKLFSFRILEGNKPVRDFVPCRAVSGEAGLWDRVEGKFYANKGRGAFVGSDVQWAPAAATIMTPWGEKVTPGNVWREYPRPQMVRANWTNLNGLWDYAVTPIASTAGRPTVWEGKILVPFAFESALSGVGRLIGPGDLMWYTRKITCVKRPGERILLNFGGSDFSTMVFISHNEVTDVPHEGGILPWRVDITDYVTDGENELTLCVWDPTESSVNAAGKQRFDPRRCTYTRVSGVWQTVWMETVPEQHITGYKVVTDIDRGVVTIEVEKTGRSDGRLAISAYDGDKKIGDFTSLSTSTYSLRLESFECWSPENPKLYTFTAKYGKDEVKGYFGMRKIAKGRDKDGVLRFFLNNKPVFMLGTLDQGWWPDGLLTPPSEEAMAFDIQTLKNYGFNMMRKHIKVEPLRYYYLCDRLGLLVIQDLPTSALWGIKQNAEGYCKLALRYAPSRRDQKEMMDLLQKIPSIVMWCPYNEGGDQVNEFLTHSMLDFTRRYDPTRLVDGPSGWFDYEGGTRANRRGSKTKHKPADVCEAADTVDMHCYRGPGMPAVNDRRISFLGEFGGLGHVVKDHSWRVTSQNWGYGGTGDTASREGLEKVYLDMMSNLEQFACKGLSGSVYTQTTDVETESNGLLTYDRKVLKFDVPKLKSAHERVIRSVK